MLMSLPPPPSPPREKSPSIRNSHTSSLSLSHTTPYTHFIDGLGQGVGFGRPWKEISSWSWRKWNVRERRVYDWTTSGGVVCSPCRKSSRDIRNPGGYRFSTEISSITDAD